MSGYRSWDQVKSTRPGPSAATRAAIEQELDDEIESVLADEDITQRAGLHLEGDEDILNRRAD